MMSAVSNYLVRRAMDPQVDPKLVAALKDLQDYRPPAWATAMFTLTVILFSIIYGTVSTVHVVFFLKNTNPSLTL